MLQILPQISLTEPDALARAASLYAEHGMVILTDAYTQPEVLAMRHALEAMEAHAHPDQGDEELLFTDGGKLWAIWNLYDRDPLLMRMALSPRFFTLVATLLGEPGVFCRATLMRKAPGVNHSVAWHQDNGIAVDRDLEDANSLGLRAGVPHRATDTATLGQIVAARVSVDDQYDDGGSLLVIPGSHAWGVVSAEEIQAREKESPGVLCPVPEGAVLFYNQLTVHCSGPSTRNDPANHRRVIHHEFRAESAAISDAEVGWWNWRNSCRITDDAVELLPPCR